MEFSVFVVVVVVVFFATGWSLFGEKRAKLLSKLIPSSVQLNLGGGGLFYSPGVEASGE